MMKKAFSFLTLILLVILLCASLPGCGGGFAANNGSGDSAGDGSSESAGNAGSSEAEAAPAGSDSAGSTVTEAVPIPLAYADQFTMERYPDGCTAIHIGDGFSYLVIPEGVEVPAWLQTGDKGSAVTGRAADETEYVLIRQPQDSVYMAASSAMDLVAALDSLDRVTMTSTKANDWSIEQIRELVDAEEIVYVGKYSAPDYEAMLECECSLAVESTMIYHNPETKEAIEALGIPVLVERSSYERDPRGRLEWIKLYGVLFGKEEEAEAFFTDREARLQKILAETENVNTEDRPRVAFFSISANGYATVRKPGDYICRMIEMAGGEYALNGLQLADDNALSTTNIQLESFYDAAVDADILIYNSAIQQELFSLDELFDKFAELRSCRAVQEGNVWCTGKGVFQRSAGICEMTEELYLIISGQTDGAELESFRKLE